MSEQRESEQERNKALVRASVAEVWERADPAAVERFYAADLRYADPGAPQITDRDSLTGLVAAIGTAFTGTRFELHDLVAEGDTVVKRFTFTATHTGEFAGIPATGVTVRVPGMSVYRLRDGQIVDGANQIDMLGFLQQLGDGGAEPGRESTVEPGDGGRASIAGSASDRGAEPGRESTIERSVIPVPEAAAAP
ncbi:MAG: ester cyclase [Pseudonocardia sp.]